MSLDQFTGKRLLRFIETFRGAQGELPTLKDLDEKGFTSEIVDQAIRDQLIEKFYVTLTNGTVVKGYKKKI